ncbi:MAG: hypothetical protein AAFW81_02060 [Pseudomonadota bacterium]
MRVFTSLAVLATGSLSLAVAHPHANGEQGHDHSGGWVHENGIGPDPDGDSNPATDTRVVPFVGDLIIGADGTVLPVIQFEPPPGEHGEAILQDYSSKYGVTFGPGLSWQICEGQRHFQYNSMCTYEAPTSGKFAAGYLDYLNQPLTIEFSEPVCLVTMSIYPTGGEADERFRFTIEARDENDDLIDVAHEDFEWSQSTVRFRNIAGAYFVNSAAKSISVSMKSLTEAKRRKESASLDDDRQVDTLRYLIDDLSFVSRDCDSAVGDVEKRTGLQLKMRILELNRDDSPE